MRRLPRTFLTLDSNATQLQKVRAAEAEHWVLGLRQAELEIQQIESFLESRHWLFRIRDLFVENHEVSQAKYFLSVLFKEVERILEEHPEIKGMSSVDVQEKYGREMQEAIEAKSLAVSILCRSSGLDPGAARLLLSRDKEQRERLIARSNEYLFGAQKSTQILELMSFLVSAPEEQREGLVLEMGKTLHENGGGSRV